MLPDLVDLDYVGRLCALGAPTYFLGNFVGIGGKSVNLSRCGSQRRKKATPAKPKSRLHLGQLPRQGSTPLAAGVKRVGAPPRPILLECPSPHVQQTGACTARLQEDLW